MTGPYSTVLTPQFISQYSGHDPTLSLVFIYIYIHTVWQVAGLEEQVAQAVAARDALQLLLTAAQVPTPIHCRSVFLESVGFLETVHSNM